MSCSLGMIDNIDVNSQCLVLPRSMTEYLARDRIPRAWKPPAWPPTVDQEEAESREDNNRDYDEDAEEDDEDFDSDADEEAIVGKGVVAQGLALNLKAHRIGLANATEEQKREFFKAKGRDLIRKAEDLIQRVKDEMI